MSRKSNFTFVYNHNSPKNEELYEFLYKLESQVKTQPYEIGNTIRQVLEILCAKKICLHKLEKEFLTVYKKERRRGIPDLNYQLKKLSDAAFINNLLPNHPGLTPLPCFDIDFTCVQFENPNTSRNKYKNVNDFLRQIGNDYSHNSNPFSHRVFKNDYKNVLYAMECLHRYIGEYLGLNRNEIGHFQEDLMPIGNYEIVRVVQPSDIAQGYCLKEFIANRYEDYHNERVGYSIIRQYRRVGKDKEEFVRRASDVYLAGDNCGSLLKQVTILSTKDSQYYIVAYDFRTSAQPINQTFLKSLLITEKLQLCLSYAEILNAFHNNSTPIYHRMLTSKCAYYTDERKNGRGISTAIIKFEFAKIEDPTIGTIFSYTREQQRRLSAEERRFLPIGSSNHWNQMDIYSLSVLFCDILMEQIGNYQITSMRQNPNIQLCANILGKMSQFEYDNISGVCSDLRALIKKTNE